MLELKSEKTLKIKVGEYVLSISVEGLQTEIPITKQEKIHEGFDEFWKAYPKDHRVGKGKCQKLWQSKKPDLEKVLMAISISQNKEQWIKGFVPNSTTWLSQERYNDFDMVQTSRKPMVLNDKGELVYE